MPLGDGILPLSHITEGLVIPSVDEAVLAVNFKYSGACTQQITHAIFFSVSHLTAMVLSAAESTYLCATPGACYVAEYGDCITHHLCI